MPMMNQWPDKFYHTSADTLDKVSIESLAKAGGLASAAVYFMANAGQSEVFWLAHEMSARFQAKLTHLVQDKITELLSEASETDIGEEMSSLERSVDYSLDRFQDSLQTLERLWDGSGVVAEELFNSARQFAAIELDRARKAAAQLGAGQTTEKPSKSASTMSEWEKSAAEIVPLRLYRGPCDFMRLASSIPAEDRTTFYGLMKSRGMQAYSVSTLAEYWSNGQRTGLEIIDLVELESGIRDPELIVTYFKLLNKLELVQFIDPM